MPKQLILNHIGFYISVKGFRGKSKKGIPLLPSIKVYELDEKLIFNQLMFQLGGLNDFSRFTFDVYEIYGLDNKLDDPRNINQIIEQRTYTDEEIIKMMTS